VNRDEVDVLYIPSIRQLTRTTFLSHIHSDDGGASASPDQGKHTYFYFLAVVTVPTLPLHLLSIPNSCRAG